MTKYEEETMLFALERAAELPERFLAEVKRLLTSGALDRDDHDRGLLFGVALENLADNFLRNERASRDYRNLTRF